jgi:hypothetical protein
VATVANKEIGFKDLRELGPGWCLKYTDIPVDSGAEDEVNMWTCFLSMHSPHNGTGTEGVDWFMHKDPEEVIRIAIQRRKAIQKEKRREAA